MALRKEVRTSYQATYISTSIVRAVLMVLVFLIDAKPITQVLLACAILFFNLQTLSYLQQLFWKVEHVEDNAWLNQLTIQIALDKVVVRINSGETVNKIEWREAMDEAVKDIMHHRETMTFTDKLDETPFSSVGAKTIGTLLEYAFEVGVGFALGHYAIPFAMSFLRIS